MALRDRGAIFIIGARLSAPADPFGSSALTHAHGGSFVWSQCERRNSSNCVSASSERLKGAAFSHQLARRRRARERHCYATSSLVVKPGGFARISLSPASRRVRRRSSKATGVVEAADLRPSYANLSLVAPCSRIQLPVELALDLRNLIKIRAVGFSAHLALEQLAGSREALGPCERHANAMQTICNRSSSIPLSVFVLFAAPANTTSAANKWPPVDGARRLFQFIKQEI